MAVDKNFVVKNGLEVNSNLIIADADSKKVGIGSTGPRSTLDVRGGIAATDGNFSGILTAASVDIANFGLVSGTGANITGFSTFGGVSADQLSVSGVGTFTDISYDEATGRNLNLTGIATVPVVVGLTSFTDGVTIAGVLTAGHFSGGGLGVGIKTSGSVIGYGFTMLNFVGSGNTFAVNGTTVDISIAGGGGGGSSGSASIGVGSTPGDAFSGIITAGNLWYNTGLGRLFIYYQDDNSAQWVDAAPFNVGIITTLTNVSFDAGTVAAPTISFGTDSNSGFFSPADGSVSVSSNGVGIVTFNGSGVNVNGVVTATSFSGDGSGLTGVASTDNIQTATEAEFLAGVKIAGVATVGVVTGGTSVSASHFYGDGSALTGIDATSIKDSGGNVKAQANPGGIVITGVATATSFSGDITGDVTGDVTGNADTATTATNITVADESSDQSCNVVFTTAATGNQAPKTGTNLTFNSNSGQLTATSFSGDGSALTGIDTTSIKDSGGNVKAQANPNGVVVTGVLTATSFVGSGSSLTFAPKIIAFDPLALQQNVAVGSSIHITFDQNIHFVGSGDVVIREGSSGGTGIQTFSITSGAAPAGLSIVDTQLIIQPSSDFNLGTSIYVTLPSSGIANTEGDSFAGSTNYNFGTVSQTFSAEGGDHVYTLSDGDSPTGYYKYHIFTGSGILTTTSASQTSPDFSLLLIGGGGGGAGSYPSGDNSDSGGGGGAGGLISHTGPTLSLATGTYTITIGAGGNPTNYPDGDPSPNPRGGSTGLDSTIAPPTAPTTFVLRAYGGGAGDSNSTSEPESPVSGGSGGGARSMASPNSAHTTPGTAIPGQGNVGGQGLPSNSVPTGVSAENSAVSSGGGGGAGEAAPNSAPERFWSPNGDWITGGQGGDGLPITAFKSPNLSGYAPTLPAATLNAIGPTGMYAGGGGGSGENWGGSGGAGGGGTGKGQNGSTPTPQAPYVPAPIRNNDPTNNDAVAHTGGGGGAGQYAGSGGNGGSGVMMIRYAAPSPS